ncbi:IclR family transcriptional regulator [Actinotignum schaalii]|uniref:IclR family transcriptional regulator n=1 Tax=Actinotignum TaxID=1653174 RepID=UPI000F7E1CE6|nr:IclR family transcriptional regulator [Actinotignum sanguinis]MDY5148053.1 IclR family transcriptional regulator [Actinotignum sanguinis]RTE48481.1 IclR family transcriptional regulator [Actinotignum sanguinis]
MRATSTTGGGVRPVKSASRTVDLLEFLGRRIADPPRLAEICAELDAPRSSTYALLRTLIDAEWVQATSTDRYMLGIRALTVGTAYIDADPYVRIVRPILVDLAKEHGETFHMGRFDNAEIVYLLTQQSDRSTRTYSRVGRRLPAAATGLGKAVLAHRPADIPEELVALTERTITSEAQLRKALTETAARGYAIDNEENTLGLHCVAFSLPYESPVRDAISCSIPSARWSAEREAEIAAAMRTAVNRILDSAPIA